MQNRKVAEEVVQGRGAEEDLILGAVQEADQEVAIVVEDHEVVQNLKVDDREAVTEAVLEQKVEVVLDRNRGPELYLSTEVDLFHVTFLIPPVMS